MKLHPTRHFFTVIFLGLLTGLTMTAAFADPIEDAVTEIRTRYNQIEEKKLRSEQIDFEATDGPGSGTCTRYYQGSELVKIHLAYSLGDHGGSDEYYYYSAGQLFFAFATDSSWGFTGTTLPNGESETIDSATEHRAYFVDGALIRHLFKEARSKDPKNLTSLLNKQANKPCPDAERAASLLSMGNAVTQVKTGDALGKLLTAE